MSEMGFGYYGQPNEGSPVFDAGADGQQAPAWYREAMGKFSEQLKAQQTELDRLRAENTRAKVADAFEAKGYARGAAALYNGDPDKVDEWLTQHGSVLAKAGTGASEVEAAAPATPPASTIPLEGQQQIQQIQQAGTGGVVTQGSDADVASALAGAGDPTAFEEIMRSHGWQGSIGDLY